MSWIRNRVPYKKLRLLLAWAGGIFLILNSQLTDKSLRIGIWLVVVGELIRIVASGYLEKKGRKLADSGPFAYVRNPLYIGNFFLGLGVVLMSGNMINLIVFLIGFFFVYFGTVKAEEQKLSEQFGEQYRKYFLEVPRLIPRFKPYSSTSSQRFDAMLLLKHREYITVAGIIILCSGMYILKELPEHWLRHYGKLVLAGVFILLSVIVLIVDFLKKGAGMKSFISIGRSEA